MLNLRVHPLRFSGNSPDRRLWASRRFSLDAALGAVPACASGDGGREILSLIDKDERRERANANRPQIPDYQGIEADCERPMASDSRVSDGVRTRDIPSHSRELTGCNSLPDNLLPFHNVAGRSAGRSDARSEGGITDTDLAALVAAWPTLLPSIRAAMMALVECGLSR